MEATLTLANEFDLPSMLNDLKLTLSRLRTETKTVSEREPPKLERLEKAIAELEQEKTAKHIFCPDEFLQYWQELSTGQRTTLEWRVVRALCWEPKVATDINFHHYLDQAWPDLNPRALRGLVIACHTMWKELANSPIVERVRHRLANYEGENRTLVRWRGAAAMILGVNGAQEFGKEIVRQTASVANACKEWQLNEQSAYVSAAMEEAVNVCLSADKSTTYDIQYLIGLLRWANWPAESFKRVVGYSITHYFAKIDNGWREHLMTFVLGDPRLGDPRLRSISWVGISEEARKRFIQWLSSEDIIFFFEHVLGKGDKHGRKDLWMKYVGRLVQSRSLLSSSDAAKFSMAIKKSKGVSGSFGRVNGKTVSAFLLDFGNIVAVEFSEVGAIRLYSKENFNKILPDFWTQKVITSDSLKNSCLNLKAIPHTKDVKIWQKKAKDALSKYGIHPDK